jgi:hypothetical protein
MVGVVVPVAVLWVLLLFVAQVRRLIAHAILNKTIRKALEVDPTSARLLIEKLEPRPRYADALSGWIMIVGGIALALASLFGSVGERSSILQVAIVAGVIGGGIIAYAWWVERQTPAT